MRLPFIVALTAVLLTPVSLVAQQSPEQKEVLAALDKFFDGMTRRDTVLTRAIMLPGSRFYVTVEGKTHISNDSSYIASLGKGKERLVERIKNPTVLVHGDLAQVWTAYDFIIDDKRSHCGVDSFIFLKTDTGWRMATAAYTIERTGCP